MTPKFIRVVSGLLQVRQVGTGSAQTRVDRFLSSPQRVDVGMIGGEAGRHLGPRATAPWIRTSESMSPASRWPSAAPMPTRGVTVLVAETHPAIELQDGRRPR